MSFKFDSMSFKQEPMARRTRPVSSGDRFCLKTGDGWHDWLHYAHGGLQRETWWSPFQKHFGLRCRACGYVECEMCPTVGFLDPEPDQAPDPSSYPEEPDA